MGCFFTQQNHACTSLGRPMYITRTAFTMVLPGDPGGMVVRVKKTLENVMLRSDPFAPRGRNKIPKKRKRVSKAAVPSKPRAPKPTKPKAAKKPKKEAPAKKASTSSTRTKAVVCDTLLLLLNYFTIR